MAQDENRPLPLRKQRDRLTHCIAERPCFRDRFGSGQSAYSISLLIESHCLASDPEKVDTAVVGDTKQVAVNVSRLRMYAAIATAPTEAISAPALMRATQIRLETGKVTPVQAAAVFDGLRYRWRGDATELKISMQYRVSTQFNWYSKRVAALLFDNFEEVVLDFYARRAAGSKGGQAPWAHR